jgi:hypothetical protein
MVALATPRFGFIPKVNLARPMLRDALECVDRGDLIGAGVRLREAVYRQLTAMCEWYNCTTKKGTLRGMVQALRNAKQIDEMGVDWLMEMIEVGNKAAHLGRVDRKSLRGAIHGLFYIIDCAPCGESPERIEHPQPENKWDDCGWDDNDDGANWWKGGAV